MVGRKSGILLRWINGRIKFFKNEINIRNEFV